MTCIPTSNSHTFTGDGVTTSITFTFQYQNTEDIKVRTGEFPDYVDIPTTAYSIDPANPTVVVFDPAPTDGVVYTIYRCTDDDALIAIFQAGSAIRAADLNDNFEQMLFITQDASNRAINLEGNVEISIDTSEEALETANNALTKAEEAIDIAEEAKDIAEATDDKVDEILASIEDQINFIPVPNVAAIPASPNDGDGVQVQDSTGIESFSPLTGLPTGFVGDPGLSVRIRYQTNTWTYVATLVPNPDDRYYTQDDADAKFETKTNAAATYETKANATATYETKTNAAATYLVKDFSTLPLLPE